MISRQLPFRATVRLHPAALAAAVLILLAVAALASRGALHGSLLSAGGHHALDRLSGRSRSTAAPGRSLVPASADRVRSSPNGSSGGTPLWLELVALVIIAGGVGSFLVIRYRDQWRAAGTAQPAQPLPAETPEQALRSAVVRSLEEVRADPNARRAIIGAYRLMETALDRVGLSRRPAEAPREYLARALGSLELSSAAPRRLTALFERARFSSGEVDLTLRDEAIDALLALQRDLPA